MKKSSRLNRVHRRMSKKNKFEFFIVQNLKFNSNFDLGFIQKRNENILHNSSENIH
jgi:hypothetical protein